MALGCVSAQCTLQNNCEDKMDKWRIMCHPELLGERWREREVGQASGASLYQSCSFPLFYAEAAEYLLILTRQLWTSDQGLLIVFPCRSVRTWWLHLNDGQASWKCNKGPALHSFMKLYKAKLFWHIFDSSWLKIVACFLNLYFGWCAFVLVFKFDVSSMESCWLAEKQDRNILKK